MASWYELGNQFVSLLSYTREAGVFHMDVQRPRAEKSKLSICGHMRCSDFQGPLSPFAFHHQKDTNFKK